MLVEKARDFLEHFPRLRRGVVANVMRVRHPLLDLKEGFHAGLAKLAVDTDRVEHKACPIASCDFFIGRLQFLNYVFEKPRFT